MKLKHLAPFAFFFLATACGNDNDSDKGKMTPENVAETIVATTQGSGSGSASGTDTAVVTRPTTATPDQDTLLADLASVKDVVCACSNRACVEEAIKAGAPFDARLDTMYQDEAKIPVAVKTKVDAIQKGIEDCTTRIGGVNAPLNDAATKVLAEFDALAAKICKCTDHACADAAMEKGPALETKLKATFQPSTEIPEEALSRMAEVENRAKACVDKLPT